MIVWYATRGLWLSDMVVECGFKLVLLFIDIVICGMPLFVVGFELRWFGNCGACLGW